MQHFKQGRNKGRFLFLFLANVMWDNQVNQTRIIWHLTRLCAEVLKTFLSVWQMKTHSEWKCMPPHNNKGFKMEVDIRAALHIKPPLDNPDVMRFLQYRQVFFIMRRNSCWFTSPSPSLSASSIISFTDAQHKEESEKLVWSHLWASDVLTWTCLSSWTLFYFANDVLYLQLFICEVLAQLFCYSLQILEWDLARLVVVEQAESFQDLLFGVLLSL